MLKLERGKRVDAMIKVNAFQQVSLCVDEGHWDFVLIFAFMTGEENVEIRIL